MTGDVRWLAIPVGLAGSPILGQQPEGHLRVLYVAVVDVLSALDTAGEEGLRDTLDLLLLRESEHT